MPAKSAVDVDATLNSGQVFLWDRYKDDWFGIDGQNVIRVSSSFEADSMTGSASDFFRLDDDMGRITAEIGRDKIVRDAVRRFYGLRLLRQSPFQCCVSFIVSSNSNIPRIKSSLQNICKKFGRKTKFQGRVFYLFPTPKELSCASIGELKDCGLGYRAEFVSQAARYILDRVDFDELKKSDYQTAKTILMDISGIGGKVADCIMLFSLEKPEAFPLDRWMIRILKQYYPDVFTIQGALTVKKYNMLHERIVEYFGPYAGYAQQFLFKMERDLHKKRWL